MECIDVSSLARGTSQLKKKILFVVNVDWFFLSHRLPIALQAQKDGYEVHIAAVITDKLEILQLHGFFVHPVKMNRGGVNIFKNIISFLHLRKIFNEVRPDILHLITIKPVILGGLLAKCLSVPAVCSSVSGLGYIYTATGPFANARRWLVNKLYLLALSHKNQIIICQNKDDVCMLTDKVGIKASKVQIICGSGVDLNEFTLAPEPLDIPVVLFPARLLKDKGIVEFAKAAAIVRSQGVSARFILAGMIDPDNPASIPFDKLSSWLDDGVLEYWGYRSDMPKVLAECNLVVLPSYREGLPKALIEAGAVGRAVITCDVPGCRDAIIDNVTGLLVPPRDVKYLVDVIIDLLNDPSRRSSMGLAGRRLAEARFNVRDVVNRHMQIYKKLISQVS